MAKRPAARVHTDLDAWKLADSLRSLVVKAVQKGGAAKDFKFRNQMRDAARAMGANMRLRQSWERGEGGGTWHSTRT
jgi:hypothetical protein